MDSTKTGKTYEEHDSSCLHKEIAPKKKRVLNSTKRLLLDRDFDVPDTLHLSWGGGRERERERDRQTDRQRDRETERERAKKKIGSITIRMTDCQAVLSSI